MVHNKYVEQRMLREGATGWAIAPDKAPDDAADNALDNTRPPVSIDDTVKGVATVQIPKQDPARKSLPYTDSELVRTYRKAKGITTGFYLRYTEACTAAVAVIACGAVLVLAGYKTDWFYLAEEDQLPSKTSSVLSSDASTDASTAPDGWVNPLWEKIYGKEIYGEDGVLAEPVKSGKSKKHKRPRKNQKYRK